MKKFSNRVIIWMAVILLSLISASIMGCVLENNRTISASFPENYVAQDYSLPEYFLTISAIAAREGILYFNGIKDISGKQIYDIDTSELIGELCYIDFSIEDAKTIIIPYAVKDNKMITQIFPNNDGTLEIVIQNIGEMRESGEQEILVKRISLSGEELLTYSIIDDVNNQKNIYMTDFMVDSTGNAYALIQDTIYVWDEIGQLRNTIKIPGSPSHMSLSREGTIYVIWLGIDGFQMASVDAEAGTLIQGHVLSPGQTYLDMVAGTNCDLLLATSDGIYEYDIEQGAEKKIISFSQLDIPAGFGGRLLLLCNDRIIWYQAENSENTFTIIYSSKEEKTSKKKILILGGTASSILPMHHQAVANFNKTSPDIRIEIKTYGSNGNDGIDELNMDIVNGRGPDIMILPRWFSMDLYARKGVLTDLYPYIENDEELGKNDLQENVLGAYEIDNKLYGIPINYWITTMVAAKSATGDIKHWNLNEMIAFAERYMPDSTVFSAANKSHILDLCLMANGDSLIKWSEEGWGFNSELFIRMLKFANHFVPDDIYIYDESLIKQIQDTEKIQILCHKNITGFAEQQLYVKAFKESVSYPGYPAEIGNGNLIDSNFVMAINSACEDKEGAWLFINSLLSEESQWLFANVLGFPIRKSVLEQKIESEMKISYKIDENGIKNEEKKYILPFGGDKIDIYAASEEDIQAVLDIINSADKIRVWNSLINDIINEEAGAFFNGNKTLEEVVNIVESRVQIYINEIK